MGISSVQFNFICIAPFTNRIVSRCFTKAEIQSLKSPGNPEPEASFLGLVFVKGPATFLFEELKVVDTELEVEKANVYYLPYSKVPSGG